MSSFLLKSIPNCLVGIEHWISSVYWSSVFVLPYAKYSIVGIYKVPQCLLSKLLDASKQGVGGYMLSQSGNISMVKCEWSIASSGVNVRYNIS